MTENNMKVPRVQDTENKNIRPMTKISVAVMLTVSVIYSFGMNFLYTYYAGDIEHTVLPSVLDIAIQISDALIPHMFSGFLLWKIYRFGVKAAAPVIAAALTGALVPYLSMFIIEALLGSIALYYKMYLRYSLLYLFDAALIALTAALIPALRRIGKHGKRSVKRHSSGKSAAQSPRTAKNAKNKKRLPALLKKAALCAVSLRLIIGLSSEIYYAAVFFDALANEYYRAIYPGELLSMIWLFALQFIYAALGLLIIHIEIKWLEKASAAKEKALPYKENQKYKEILK